MKKLAILILALSLSACGQIPSEENIKAFKNGDRGKISFDLSGLEGTRFYWMFKNIEPKVDYDIHSDCFKDYFLNMVGPIDILQEGLSLPIPFIRENIHNINDAHRYIFSQTLSIFIKIDHLMPAAAAQANFDSITFDEAGLEDGEERTISRATHEIMHVIGFGHVDQIIDLRFYSIPYRAGEVARICAMKGIYE